MEPYETKKKELIDNIIELKEHIKTTPEYTKMQEEHLKYQHLIDEQFAKMLLANKIIDDKVKTSDEPRYVEMRGYVAAKDKINEFASRKFAYFYEMDKLGGNWKVNWEDEICTYYKNLPYHDEVNIYLDGKHIVIPKKTGLEHL